MRRINLNRVWDMDKLVVTELIQDQLTVSNLEKELGYLLNNEQRIAAMKKDYAALKALLSRGGNASANAASLIVNFLTK